MKRTRLIPALALTAALTLAGCSGVGSDLGVSVNGQDYSVDELQQATVQLGQVTEQESAPQQVITDLALLPVLEDVFSGSPAVITDAQVHDVLGAGGVAEPNDATMDAARSRQYQIMLGDPATFQDPAMADVLVRAQGITQEDLAAVDVEVNPRYGSWDLANGGVVEVAPTWIKSTDDS